MAAKDAEVTDPSKKDAVAARDALVALVTELVMK